MLKLMSVSQRVSVLSEHRAAQTRCPRPKSKSIKTLSPTLIGVMQEQKAFGVFRKEAPHFETLKNVLLNGETMGMCYITVINYYCFAFVFKTKSYSAATSSVYSTEYPWTQWQSSCPSLLLHAQITNMSHSTWLEMHFLIHFPT